ncbi:uncharacterized protein VTP21DRAFT_11500 [Calcarisporiella thermophila]|uniref:uncharacterized protein n=1 Tax=Calcarisporiella thermophila TaxID=911321 RepID=UPI0037442F7A
MSAATDQHPVKVPPRSKKHSLHRRENGFITYLERHQISLPIYIMTAIIIAYLAGVPGTWRFLFIAYQHPDGTYGKGWLDTIFLTFYALFFTALRAIVIRYILRPVASAAGIVKKREITRFCEQGWACLYYSTAFSVGIYIASGSEYWFDFKHFWLGYPHLHFTALFKYYYLLQFSFWIHQFFVLQIEDPRKDYRELVMHHVNTCVLIFASYCCNFTRIGNAVFCSMDFADIFLALAKCLYYLKFETASNIVFAFLLVCWTYSRLYVYTGFMYSTLVDSFKYIPNMHLKPSTGWWCPWFVPYIIFTLLLGLYVLNIFWTYLMFRIAYRTLRGKELKDDRSDDEDEGKKYENGHANGNKKAD